MIARTSTWKRLGFAAALLALFGGLVVEIHIRREVAAAQRSLGGAFGHATLPDTAGDNAQEALTSAHDLARCGDLEAATALLDGITRQAPDASLHHLAATAHRAEGNLDAAAAHAEFAARLSDGDVALRHASASAVDLALVGRVQPVTRVLGTLAALLLAWLGLHVRLRRAQARRRARWLQNLHGTLTCVADGRPLDTTRALTPSAGRLDLDIYLLGAGGVPRPAPRGSEPSLHISCSHAASGRTLRLRRVPDFRGGAVRVAVTPETLARLREHAGRWRIQALVDGHRVAFSDLHVTAAPARVA